MAHLPADPEPLARSFMLASVRDGDAFLVVRMPAMPGLNPCANGNIADIQTDDIADTRLVGFSLRLVLGRIKPTCGYCVSMRPRRTLLKLTSS